jgi:hypothetical protein
MQAPNLSFAAGAVAAVVLLATVGVRTRWKGFSKQKEVRVDPFALSVMEQS